MARFHSITDVETGDTILVPFTPEEESARDAEAAVAAALVAREGAFVADAQRADLVTRLKSASPAQIDNWIDGNVTSIATARAVLKAIVKVLALHIRD
jgi:hypothetical protein